MSESRIKIFTSTAKQAWNELYRHRLDPTSWTKKTPKAVSYLVYVLKTNFAEFSYCDEDWKLEQFAVIKYPDWCRDAREPERLTRTLSLSHVWHFFFFLFPFFLMVLGARPSKCRKSGNSDNNNRRWKKAKAKSTVPSGMQVIDLVDNVLARSTASHSATSSALPSATVMPQLYLCATC